MSEHTVVARPYAKAIFQLAREKSKLVEWDNSLVLLKDVCANPGVVNLINNPQIEWQKIAELIFEVYSKISSADVAKIGEQVNNLVKLLAENHRLALLPEILHVFEQLRAEHEKRVEVQITSSQPLTDTQKEKMSAALQQRFERKVSVHYVLDPKLLGGAVIRVGDHVIDGSARGKLTRLVNHLKLKEKVCQ